MGREVEEGGRGGGSEIEGIVVIVDISRLNSFCISSNRGIDLPSLVLISTHLSSNPKSHSSLARISSCNRFASSFVSVRSKLR